MTTEADLRARIAELEARLAGALRWQKRHKSKRDIARTTAKRCHDGMEYWKGRAEAAEAALAEAVEAMRPFAAAAQRFDEAAEHFKADRPADDSKPRTDFTLGQLRAARAFIDEHGVTFTDDGKAVCVRIGD